MKPGLVSISFRNLTSAEIIPAAVDCGLEAIEWGGDVHVPPGDPVVARSVGEATRAAGLEVAAYGSYYRCEGDPEADFRPVLESAEALKAPLIRVWAGRQGSASATEGHRAAVASNLAACARMAADAGIAVALEYHANTLTDDMNSALALLRTASVTARPYTLWQPPNGASVDHALETLNSVLPWLRNVHVFSWELDPDQDAGGIIRLPLAAHAERWKRYLAVAHRQGSRYALLEFVKNDSLEQLREDAATLRQWLGGLRPAG